VLFFLGYRALRAAWAGPAGEDQGAAVSPGDSPWRRFTAGFVVQLANPKAAVFMFAFYPQFVPAESALAWTAGLALLQVLVETALYLGLAAVVGRASQWFRRPRVRRRLEAISGTVLVALAVRMAVTPR
jgi:threonine/homoserine/homoserine lactone efflux protein